MPQHKLFVIRSRSPEVLYGAPDAIRSRYERLKVEMLLPGRFAPMAIFRYGARNQLLDSFMTRSTARSVSWADPSVYRQPL